MQTCLVDVPATLGFVGIFCFELLEPMDNVVCILPTNGDSAHILVTHSHSHTVTHTDTQRVLWAINYPSVSSQSNLCKVSKLFSNHHYRHVNGGKVREQILHVFYRFVNYSDILFRLLLQVTELANWYTIPPHQLSLITLRGYENYLLSIFPCH